MNKLPTIGLAVSTAILSLGIIGESPAEAASFLFDFNGNGQGSLSFKNTPLTGLTGSGKESISIDDLYSLAEDVNFEYSYPTTLYNWDEGDFNYGDFAGYSGEIFHFLNGNLTGMNFIFSFPIDYGSSGGSRIFEQEGEQFFFVRNDRFTEFVNVEESEGGLVDCYPDTSSDVENEICEFDHFEQTITHQIEEEGISYTKTGFYEQTFIDYFGEGETNTYPFSESGFLAFNEMQEITFTTIEPVPEPITILGTGTAIAFGVALKKSNRKRTK